MFPDKLEICAPFSCPGSEQSPGGGTGGTREASGSLPLRQAQASRVKEDFSVRDRLLQEVLALKEPQPVSPWEAAMAVEASNSPEV